LGEGFFIDAILGEGFFVVLGFFEVTVPRILFIVKENAASGLFSRGLFGGIS
jgi:hypothetical protein